jgi:hypothetical protein
VGVGSGADTVAACPYPSARSGACYFMAVIDLLALALLAGSVVLAMTGTRGASGDLGGVPRRVGAPSGRRQRR